MQLSELKLVFASNLIRLRSKAGMTQAELGAMLNYSDKSVSKWERGEAIPDAWVLTRLLAVWTMALIAFVVLWWVGILWWPVFAVALSVSLLAVLILTVYFKHTKHLQYVLAGFVLSVFVMLYVLMLPWRNNWQLFLIAVPALALVFLGCNIRKRPRRSAK